MREPTHVLDALLPSLYGIVHAKGSEDVAYQR